MISRRDATITLEATTGRTYADIASEFDIGIARVGQIVTKTLETLRLSRKGVTKEEIGLALQRRRYQPIDAPGFTPESFYWDELRNNQPAPSESWHWWGGRYAG